MNPYQSYGPHVMGGTSYESNPTADQVRLLAALVQQGIETTRRMLESDVARAQFELGAAKTALEAFNKRNVSIGGFGNRAR